MSVQTPNVNPDTRCQSKSPMSVQTPDVPLRPGFRSTLGAGDVLAHFFPGKIQSPVTHQKCRVFDPVSLDKNAGASPPVLVVGPDWPDLDFFFDPESEVRIPILARPAKRVRFRRTWGPLGPHRAHVGAAAPLGALGAP